MVHRFKGAVAAVAALALIGGLVAVAPSASAQSDEEIIAGNVPTALEVLAEGLQDAADVAADTQSAVQTSAAVGAALVASGTALVDGTDPGGDFGALPFGLQFANLAIQQGLNPFLEAIDDPSLAADLLTAEDVQLIVERLPQFVDDVQAGCDFGVGLKGAIVHLLQGNITEAPLGLGPSFYVGAVLSPTACAFYLTEGTNLQGLFTIAGIVELLVAGATLGYVDQVEDAIAPVLDALSPVTGPLIDVLSM